VIELNVKVLASTLPGSILDLGTAEKFSGHAAGICYMPDSFETILDEPFEKTMKRANMVLQSGHHSVFDHASYTLLLENIPKILAMVLNNEKAYATSEKSARYTQMQPSDRERELYDKWMKIFTERILSVYPDTLPEKAKKLAQENARYLISVFTPTTMAYTTTLRQWDYIIHWFKKFIDSESQGESEYENRFFDKLKLSMKEFLNLTESLVIPGLDDEAKDRSLSLFDSCRGRETNFGETYCTTYRGSFAQLAQAHRHRTIDYKMSFLDTPECYVPPILVGCKDVVEEWVTDFKSVSDLWPQGTLISICERGTYDNFILKTKERLCSNAQLEISQQTWKTMAKYINHTGYGKNADAVALHRILCQYDCGARCGSGYKCKNPCKWGVKQQDRLI